MPIKPTQYKRNSICWDKRVFPNFSSYLDQAEFEPYHPAWRDHLSSETGTPEFTGTKSFQEAIELARYGCPELLTHMVAITDSLTPHVTSSQEVFNWHHSFAGCVPDVPRFIAGDPIHMLSPKLDIIPYSPIVRLLVSIGATGTIPPNILLHRGAAIVSCVDELENQGYSCEVCLFDCSEDGGYRAEYIIPVKQAGEPWELDRMAYSIAHPSVLRRIGFRLNEQCGELREGGHFFGYGRPCDAVPESDQIYFPSLFLENASNYLTPEVALSTIKSKISSALKPVELKH